MSNLGEIKKALESPKTKDVLILLGIGTFLAASIVAPGLPMAAKPVIDYYKKRQQEKERKEWNRFNQGRLKQLLKRLYDQKVIDITEDGENSCLKLTNKGKTKFLKFKLEEIMVNHPPKWDGKWRIIIYDIPKEKKTWGEIFRKYLQKLEFLKLQKSVYLTPYRCEDQIEFLRQYYGLGKEIIYIVAQKVENESVYKEYFGI